MEVLFGKADNEENKKGFDFIFAHKDEIESTLGERLIWDRGDDKKSSKIYYKIEGVGIEKEEDWPTIARFLSKWTIKLYDTIVAPYLLPFYRVNII